MKERPILFGAPMVRALLDGSKTQTRRAVKYVPALGDPQNWCPDVVERNGYAEKVIGDYRRFCPYGVPGHRLWVRETWQHADWTEDGEPYVRYAADNAVRFCEGAGEGESLVDRWAELSDRANFAIDGKAADRRWRPSIFMPRWASRLTLTITDVRVERLAEISETDAIAEGCVGLGSWKDPLLDGEIVPAKSARYVFARLWESLNAKRAPWSSNPWVWVLTFAQADT